MFMTRCFDSEVIKGPMSLVGSIPLPTVRADAWLQISEIIQSFFSWRAKSPAATTNTNVDNAMHRCPAAPKAAPTMAGTAFSNNSSDISSNKITAWFFAPRLAWTRLPCFDESWWMYRPTRDEPTKETARTAGWVQIWSTIGFPPWTTCSTFSGSPQSSYNICASNRLTPGVFSEGFSTKVLPAAMARGNIHNGIMAGKLNGQMPAQTPSGSR
mmetsp:Transcript_32087/g.47394  ORF Transcript_32087/g.47394 Transcript_32087/m.47394 type:complete len:213 (+) Transcript_32087:543-1181(+)